VPHVDDDIAAQVYAYQGMGMGSMMPGPAPSVHPEPPMMAESKSAPPFKENESMHSVSGSEDSNHED